jgi:hypothetical protein
MARIIRTHKERAVVRWAARVTGIYGTVCIVTDGGVIAAFTERIFCAAAEGAWKDKVGAHGGVVQITVRNLILYH